MIKGQAEKNADDDMTVLTCILNGKSFPREILKVLQWLDPKSLHHEPDTRRVDRTLRRLKTHKRVEFLGQKLGWRAINLLTVDIVTDESEAEGDT